MKTWIKTALATAAAATIGLGASAAIAGGSGDCGGMRGGAAMHGGEMHGMHRMHGMKHRMDPAAISERADQRLAKLEEALALKPGQRAAWDEFSSTMRGKAAKAAERMESMHTRERPATALERLERMEEFGKERLESMQGMRKAVAALYTALDDGQKKIFDAQFHMAGPRHLHDGRWRGGRGGADQTERGPGA